MTLCILQVKGRFILINYRLSIISAYTILGVNKTLQPEYMTEKIISDLYAQILNEIGEDINRDGLINTPGRAARALLYLTRGYSLNLEDVVNDAVFETDNNQMVIVKDIELYSLCEHHLLPFIGKCHVAYLPKGKVIGLSKIARIVDMYARRLQIQETLTNQIALALQAVTNSAGVGVIIEAQHLCMMMRGVEKQNSVMKTSMMLGAFKVSVNTRSEFLNLVKD